MTEDGDEKQFPPPPTAGGPTRPKPTRAEPAPVKLTKAERLEAKAARLRDDAARRAQANPAAPTGPTVRTGPTPTAWIVSTAVLAAVCAGLIALGILLFLSRQHQKDVSNRLESTASVRADAVEVAKTFAVDFGSYDYQHLDTDFTEVATRMTPSFAKSYTDTSDRLKSTFLQYKTQVTARLQGYGVTSVTKSRAVVIVFLDQTVRTTQSSTPRIDRNRLEVDLVRVKGKWLVAKLLAK
jgi:Mce-associated membrane protein